MQKKIITILFFLFVQKTLLAQINTKLAVQKHTRDSLIKLLPNYKKQDTVRVNILSDIFENTLFLKERKEVLPYWEEAKLISEKLGFTYGIARCLYWKALYIKSEKNYPLAHIYLDSVLAITEATSAKYLLRISALAQMMKGQIYLENENYYSALKYLLEAARYQELNFDKKLLYTYRLIIRIYLALNNENKAVEYLHKSIVLGNKTKDINGNTINLSEDYINLSKVFITKKDYGTAQLYLDSIKEKMPDTLETMITYSYYQQLGIIKSKLQKFNDASFNFSEALIYAKAAGHRDIISGVLNNLTQNELEQNNIIAAKKYADQNIIVAREYGQKGIIADALKNLSIIYFKTGKTNEAYLALKEATELGDSIITEANLKQINTLTAIYENEKRENEIGQLKSEKQLQVTSLKQKSLINTILLVVASSLFFIGLLGYRNFRAKQKIQQQQITQLEKEKQLQAVDAMLQGQEEERSRLAKDLHDGLGGMLSGVKISFSNMKENMIMDANNTAMFERSINQLDSSISELRKVAHNLMPESLVKFGLIDATKDFCNSIAAVAQIKIVFESIGEKRVLGNTADVYIYRIIQELVNNAIKHASAKQILVQLTTTNNNVLLTVEDDGKGFDKNILATEKGIGLSNIQHRVDYFKGQIDIDSKLDEGTSVHIELTV